MSCLPSIPVIGNNPHACARSNSAFAAIDGTSKTAPSTQVLNRLQSLCYEPSIPEESRRKLLAVLNTLQGSGANASGAVSQQQPLNDESSSNRPNSAQYSKEDDVHASLWHMVYTQNDDTQRPCVEGFNIAASPFSNFAKSNSLNRRSMPVLQDHTETFESMNKVMCQTMRYVESVSELEFDINDVREYDNSVMVDKERLFMSVCCSVFSNFSFITTLGLDLQKLTNFLADIFSYYSKEHYFHTSLHAADALQMLSLFFREPNTNFLFTDEEILLAFLSVLCLDVAHPALRTRTLTELQHPLVTVFGGLAGKRQASVLVFLHQLCLEEHVFWGAGGRVPLQAGLHTLVGLTAGPLRPCLLRQLERIAGAGRVASGAVPWLLAALACLAGRGFLFRPRRQGLFWAACRHAEAAREAAERRRRGLPPDPNAPGAGIAAVVASDARAGKALADAIRSLVPIDLYDNLERYVEMGVGEADLAAAGGAGAMPMPMPMEIRPWCDNSAAVFEILRKNTAHANSLDRKASKYAILNASPQRSVTHSMERSNSTSHVSSQPSISDVEVDCCRTLGSRTTLGTASPTRPEHYFSFLRLYDEFERNGRPSSDFSGQLIFLALQLDPHYIGRYAREVFGDNCTVQQCVELAALIRSVEESPSTAEVIASRRAGSHSFVSTQDEPNNTDGFLLLLMNMYFQREEAVEHLVGSHVVEENNNEDTDRDYKSSLSRVLRWSGDTKAQQDSPTRLPVNTDTSEVRVHLTMNTLIPNSGKE